MVTTPAAEAAAAVPAAPPPASPATVHFSTEEDRILFEKESASVEDEASLAASLASEQSVHKKKTLYLQPGCAASTKVFFFLQHCGAYDAVELQYKDDANDALIEKWLAESVAPKPDPAARKSGRKSKVKEPKAKAVPERKSAKGAPPPAPAPAPAVPPLAYPVLVCVPIAEDEDDERLFGADAVLAHFAKEAAEFPNAPAPWVSRTTVSQSAKPENPTSLAAFNAGGWEYGNWEYE